MSAEATSWAWSQNAGTAGPKVLLLALANRADEYGVTFAGRKDLAARCEFSPRSVSENLQRLEDRGLIARVDRARENGSRASTFTILAPGWTTRSDLEDCPAGRYPQEVVSLAQRQIGEDSSPTPSPIGEDSSPGHVKNLHHPIATSVAISKEQEEQTDRARGASPVEHLWARFVAMRQRSKKQLRRTEIDQQTSRMIAVSLEVGSVEEWSKAIDAILLSSHHRGENDRGRAYLEPRHIFTACSHGTVRQHLDWLLDLSQTAGDGVTSALNAKVRQAKVNVVAAFDLAGSAAARRKGDESREFLAQHGISVVFDGAGGRPRFEESASPQR